MKKRTIWRTLLVIVMCASMVMNAFAATVTETVTNPDGSTVETTTTTTEGEGSKKTVVVTITTSAPAEDGSTTTTTVEEGEEIINKDGDLSDLPADSKVTVELKPGEGPVTGSVDKTYTEGEAPAEGTAEYDYTITDREIDREVTASASELDVKVTVGLDDMTAMAPEDYDGKHYHNGKTYIDGKGKQQFSETPEGLAKGSPDEFWNENYGDYYAGNSEAPTDENGNSLGYDFQWTGYAESTNAARAEAMDVVYAKDPETGEPLKDEDGNYVIESMTYTGKYGDGMGSTPAIFALTKYDEEGNKTYYYGYCIDNDTEAVPSTWYSMANLEDSNYYPDAESAAKLRAIVNNGYFGQADGKGSLAKLEADLAAYYGENVEVTIKDKNGNDLKVSMTIDQFLAKMNEADALTATQAAIWSNANGTLATQDGQDGTIITGIYSVKKPKPYEANTDRDYDYQRDAVLQATYDYLMNLEGEAAEEGSVILNEHNAMDNMSLTVGNKVGQNGENGIYEADLKFTMSYTPSEINDDLLVHISYKNLEGETVTVTKRLAGNDEETGFGTITKGDDGYYTISGLQLSENEDIDLEIKLDGKQELNQDVYIYSAFGGSTKSQTMVGIAGGERDVTVSATVSVNFKVEESEKITEKHFWRNESTTTNPPEEEPEDPPYVPEEPPVVPQDPPVVPEQPPVVPPVEPVDPPQELEDINEEDVPLEDIPDEDVPLEDIPDEEVPLAAVPQTGDASIYFAILSALSGTGLAGLALTKKREEI